MRTHDLARFVILGLCSLLSSTGFAENTFVDKLGEEKIQQISDSAQWRKILYYAPSWGRGDLSLVDDPKFFINPAGRTVPEDELVATLRAFTEGMLSSRQEALCKYPARRKFLEAVLKTTFDDVDPENSSEICKRYKVFSTRVKSESASLIFSSYYPGNPGSLFGHTFLKFKKMVSNDGETSNALLDYGLNHAAHPTTLNPILYPIMGLSGMFPGMISMMPYYVKVQEYNNAESRDLWEYDLNLTPAEISMMLASVFELSTHRIDYFYFDDNCSYLMLAMIDVGRPSLNLVSKFRAWVIPGDTVRVVSQIPSLVGKISFRPSNVRKYLNLESQLTEKERSAFLTLMFAKKIDESVFKKAKDSKAKIKRESRLTLAALTQLDKNEQTRVLDTALEFIDSTEQLAGTKQPAKWSIERDALLRMRAELGTTSEPNEVATPENEAPHIAYPPTRLSLGVVNTSQPDSVLNPAILLGWRPALHTLDNPVAGMGADLGVGFFNVELLMRRGKLSLREFTPLSIESMALPKPNISSTSWSFDISYRQRCFDGCRQISVNVEAGSAYPTESPDDRLALRGGMRIGDDEVGALFIEPAVVGIANFPFELKSRWVSRLALSRMMSLWAGPKWILEGSTTYVYRIASPWELQAGVQLLNNELQIMARTHYYF